MSSRGRDYDRPYTKQHQRSRSRADVFLDALEGGNIRDALGTLKAEGTTRRSCSSHPHPNRHHHHHDYDYYEEQQYPSYYYHEEKRRSSRHHHQPEGERRRRHDDDHHRRRHHSNSSTRREDNNGIDFRQAAGAAMTAGLVEAFRSRHDVDNRTKRVATAAIGAAATDSALHKERGEKKKKRTVIESAVAGLVENRVINGPRR
ncbi:hypothetical protein GGS20DRAFT_568479 [Poronia punctata]|nr:hypothetical protein GGS20DRAFT_568479 [Poronia punctata]